MLAAGCRGWAGLSPLPPLDCTTPGVFTDSAEQTGKEEYNRLFTITQLLPSIEHLALSLCKAA